MKVVSNASVLIALSTIGRLPLVHERFPSGLIIPRAVWREVVLEGGTRPGALGAIKFIRELPVFGFAGNLMYYC